MNPIQSNFTALQKIWSRQGGAHRAPKLWVASKLSCSLTELIFLPAFHTLQIFPLSFVTTKLFSQMEIVLMQMLSRNWTDSILCIPSELMHIQGPVPSFPDRSNSCSHTKMFDGTERGEKHWGRLMGSWTQRVAVGGGRNKQWGRRRWRKQQVALSNCRAAGEEVLSLRQPRNQMDRGGKKRRGAKPQEEPEWKTDYLIKSPFKLKQFTGQQ